MTFDNPSRTGAQQVLVRLLRLVLPEEEKCREVIGDALRSAEMTELPTNTEELLRFVKVHLAPPLTNEVGSKLARAFRHDFTAEIDQLKTVTRQTTTSPMRAAKDSLTRDTPHVAVPVVRPPAKDPAPREDIGERIPFPKLRQSVANLVRTASTKIRLAIGSTSKNPITPSHYEQRPSVLLVHPDRVVRASIARALVNARFDVTGFDSTPQLIPALRTRNGACIAVLDIWEKGAEATLQSLAMANADVRILAWTDIEATVAESVFVAAGVKRFAVLSKSAAAIELVDGARQLCRASPG